MKEKDSNLKERLTDMQYAVTQHAETEPPGTGEYLYNEDDGMYHCVVCGATLFDSSTKFNSDSGWPSFDKPADKKNVELVEDTSLGMRRTEVKCKNCGAHLGHIFPDGPTETGDRYCINSASLAFKKK